MKSTIATSIELREQGMVNICGAISDDSMKTIVEELVYINTMVKPNFKAIQMILNSPGGTMPAGFMVTDFIEFSKMPVYITGLGTCASMGLLILCSGTKGHRIITKNTRLLSHQYSWETSGKYHELIADRKEQNMVQERMIRHYLKHTKLNKRQIKEILLPATDVWMTGKEAKKYGLIDKVV
ncbi:MAG: ATP-dependent Clp protease proteolytic subunit [Phycisphaerae bacterium]|nr:ATP-dependent Clp protease proteolytic subunit [Phycisphaerae bacterium]